MLKKLPSSILIMVAITILLTNVVYATYAAGGAGGAGGSAGANGSSGTSGSYNTNLPIPDGDGGGGGGGGGGSAAGGNGGNGAGGGIVISVSSTLNLTSSTIDNRGGGSSNTNSGTVKLFYTGSVPSTAGITTGNLFLVTPGIPTLITPTSGATLQSALPTFTLRAIDQDLSYLTYYIEVYDATACGGSLVRSIDQSASQTGWRGQDQNSSQAYTGAYDISGSTVARYVYQSPPLLPNHLYSWRARAIDPAGTNAYGAYSSCQDFTTAQSEVQIQGGVEIRGGTTIQ